MKSVKEQVRGQIKTRVADKIFWQSNSDWRILDLVTFEVTNQVGTQFATHVRDQLNEVS